MRLHLASIGDTGLKYLDEEYVDPTDTLSIDDIVVAINNEEFDEIKDCKIAHVMWIKLKEIYGGDDNVRRAKVESLRG